MLLADEMGLGKTIQAIAAMRLLYATSGIRSCLVVTPAGLVRQWRRQLRDWAPELRISTVVGTAAE
jgi:SNF2 family DNA or RNA helicase